MASLLEKSSQNKIYQENKKKFNELKNQIINNLDKIANQANDITIEEKYLVDYISQIKDGLKEISYDQIFILEFVNLLITDILTKISDNDFIKIKILYLHNFLNNYFHIEEGLRYFMGEYFNDIYQNMVKEVEKFRQINEVLKNEKTYQIYQTSEGENNEKYWCYILASIIFAIIGSVLSVFSRAIYTQCVFENFCILEYSEIDYWIMKASVVFITITGITFCLKQAIHHQKKKDQVEKTRLELEALPTYMTYFDDTMKNEIYKELLPRYFGRDFDNEGYQAMSDVIQEQIKLSNEILRSLVTKNNNKNGQSSG